MDAFRLGAKLQSSLKKHGYCPYLAPRDKTIDLPFNPRIEDALYGHDPLLSISSN